MPFFIFFKALLLKGLPSGPSGVSAPAAGAAAPLVLGAGLAPAAPASSTTTEPEAVVTRANLGSKGPCDGFIMIFTAEKNGDTTAQFYHTEHVAPAAVKMTGSVSWSGSGFVAGWPSFLALLAEQALTRAALHRLNWL